MLVCLSNYWFRYNSIQKMPMFTPILKKQIKRLVPYMFYQLIVSLAIFIPSLVFFFQKKEKEAFWLLLFAALVIRLMMIGLDPFLHHWDEHFHAAVAKNMMAEPFKPMMRTAAILPYKVEDWCCNHIWVHKQPLFLWQMALSLKLFGLNTIALRLPNALMGTFMVFALYRIGQLWTGKNEVAYLSALLFAAGYYNLELTAGGMSLDHNDMAMGCYVTASIWAFCAYWQQPSRRWAVWVGVFVGCAILNKWLTGLLVFGGWGLVLVFDNEKRRQWASWKDLGMALLVACLVFVPWQIYINIYFPAETAAAYKHNVQHILEDLSHPGDALTHLLFLKTAYGSWLLVALGVLGLLLGWANPSARRLSLPMTAMFAVVYLFFSVVVATKMPGLTFPVAAIGFIWVGMGLHAVLDNVFGRLEKHGVTPYLLQGAAFMLACGVLALSFRPDRMADARRSNDPERVRKIHNTEIYKSLHKQVSPNEVVLNCKSFEDTDVRFWQPNNAYHWYPTEPQVDSLLRAGYALCAFKSHTDQQLPDYLAKNPKVKILDLEIW